VGDFAYAVGVVAQVARAREQTTRSPAPSVALANASTCVRQGFDHPAKLALRYLSKTTISRVRTHKLAAPFGNLDGPSDETFGALRARMQATLEDGTTTQ
jgi:hypothetical protein